MRLTRLGDGVDPMQTNFLNTYFRAGQSDPAFQLKLTRQNRCSLTYPLNVSDWRQIEFIKPRTPAGRSTGAPASRGSVHYRQQRGGRRLCRCTTCTQSSSQPHGSKPGAHLDEIMSLFAEGREGFRRHIDLWPSQHDRWRFLPFRSGICSQRSTDHQLDGIVQAITSAE